MSCELKDGMELRSIETPPLGEHLEQSLWHTGNWNIGHECTRIVVTIENGQMAGVPWARCERVDGLVDLVNLATVQSITLAQPLGMGDQDGN